MACWRMSFRLGSKGTEMWEECRQRGIAAMGAYTKRGELVVGDCSKITEEEFDLLWKKRRPHNTAGQSSLRNLAYRIKVGDTIYVKQGPQIVGKGRVTQGYQFDPDILAGTDASWEHYVKVDWDTKFQPVSVLLGAELITVLRLSQERLKTLKEAIALRKRSSVEEKPGPGKKPPKKPLPGHYNLDQGVECSDLDILQPMLLEWIRLNQDERWWSNDGFGPWCYNERTSMGLLAGALWRCEELTLEEFGFDKIFREQRRLIRYSGRGDLWFSVGDTSFYAEAKQRRPRLGGVKSSSMAMNEYLGRACQDAKRLRAGPENIRLGLLFYVPWIQSSKEDQVEQLLDRLLDQAHQTQCIARAWVFPDWARRSLEGEDYLHPGILLLIRRLG